MSDINNIKYKLMTYKKETCPQQTQKNINKDITRDEFV